MLSVNLTIRGTPVLVIGGGNVGRRRAAVLAAAGAVVTVVDPAAIQPLLPPGVRHLQEPFRAVHLEGIRLAFACATAEVNAEVAAFARQAGVWVSNASDPEGSDFTLPSVAERGGLKFAVSTGGASPALAKRIAAEVLNYFDDSYAEWVRVLGLVREAVRERVADEGERRRLLAEFADPVWLEELRDYGADAVLADMLAEIGEPAD